MAYTYILKLCNGRYYVGFCRNLHDRLDQHIHGYVRSTKQYLPISCMYARPYSSYSEAYAEEQRIKRWKKRRSIENLIQYDKNNIIRGPIV